MILGSAGPCRSPSPAKGADVCIAYLDEHKDAEDTGVCVEKAGRKAALVAGDLADPAFCRDLVKRAADAFGGTIDVVVNNAAHQPTFESIDDPTDEEWDYTFAVNSGAMFRVTKAALTHMRAGGSIINMVSIQADNPTPMLLAYVRDDQGGDPELHGEPGPDARGRKIRANCVAPRPIWTPLIPATMPPEAVESFGKSTPLGRCGQPAELAPAYVLLASDAATYLSGGMLAVTGGKPLL